MKDASFVLRHENSMSRWKRGPLLRVARLLTELPKVNSAVSSLRYPGNSCWLGVRAR